MQRDTRPTRFAEKWTQIVIKQRPHLSCRASVHNKQSPPTPRRLFRPLITYSEHTARPTSPGSVFLCVKIHPLSDPQVPAFWGVSVRQKDEFKLHFVPSEQVLPLPRSGARGGDKRYGVAQELLCLRLVLLPPSQHLYPCHLAHCFHIICID